VSSNMMPMYRIVGPDVGITQAVVGSFMTGLGRSIGATVLDVYWGGLGKITGTVKYKGDPANVPAHLRVRLLRARDGVAIREVWSRTSDGYYEFKGIDPSVRYIVLAYDHGLAFRPKAASNLLPDPL
jgi:hypothetical protein